MSTMEFVKTNKRGLFTIFVFVLYVSLIAHFKDKLNSYAKQQYRGYVNLFVLAGGFMIPMMYFFYVAREKMFSMDSKKPSPLMYFLKVGISTDIVVAVIALVGAAFWLFSKYKMGDGIVTAVIDILIVVAAIAVVYKYIYPYFSKVTTTLPAPIALIRDAVIFLPCILINVVEWFRHQFSITPKAIWILLVIEVLLVISRFLIPWLVSKAASAGGVLLLDGPIYMDKETTVSNFKQIYGEIKTDGDDVTHPDKLYSYAISSKIYINPQPPNTRPSASKFTPLVNFEGKPLLSYETSTNTLQASMNGKNVFKEAVSLPLQKWNTIILNLKDSMLDVWINGKLVGTGPATEGKRNYETITVGSDNGVEGAIKDVQFFHTALGLSQIKALSSIF